jgi:hypothetical protein
MSQEIEMPLEVVQPSVIEALERASIDVQVSTAHAYPRSLKKFQQRAMDMVCLDAETAESCIYVRPVGKDSSGKQQYAEGPSIRLAEIVAASYGNLRVASRIIEQTPRFVKCEGVAHDLEVNYAGKSETVEPTVTKNGTPYSEGMRAVVAKATLSKAYRDAVFKVVPKALCKSIIDAAKRIASGEGKPIEARRAKAQLWAKTLKTKNGRSLDERRIFEALGVAGWVEVGEEQLLLLAGLRTSISDGDVSVDDAFPSDESEAPKTPDFGKKTKSVPVKEAPPETDHITSFWLWVEEKGLFEADVLKWLEISDPSELTQERAEKINRDEMLADLVSN